MASTRLRGEYISLQFGLGEMDLGNVSMGQWFSVNFFVNPVQHPTIYHPHMANASHFELGCAPITNIFMCLSCCFDKPLCVFAYYVCEVQVLHVLSANRCTWGGR